MTYEVSFSPEAEDQLAVLYNYIALEATPGIAARFTESIVAYCEGFSISPHRGNMRDDIRPGLRVTNYEKRTIIAFIIDVDLVVILGVFYGGQDFETVLGESDSAEARRD